MEGRPPQRWRSLVPALLSVAVLAYVLFTRDAQQGVPLELDDTPAEGDERLRVEWVEPVEVSPGAAVVAHVSGAVADEAIDATVSGGGVKVEAKVLHREGGRVVVRMPRELPEGVAKLRLVQGERRSKPRLLQIRAVPVRDVLRDVLGGLALFVLGLRMIGQAFRTYSGQRVRERLARLTGNRLRGAGLGAMLGGLTQSTTSSAGVLAGLIEGRMLSLRGAAVMLAGVQLGAATAGAVLPLVATREALWVVVIGAVWFGFADNRRARAFGSIILGLGLLFLGLRLLQEGFRPLLANPELLPYLHHLRVDDVGGALLAVAAGALLCGALQGPGPVFALVLSLSATTGVIGLRDGLAILAGTPLGAVVGTWAVGLSLGRRGLRLAGVHLLLAMVMTAVALAGLPLWEAMSAALSPGDPALRSYGTRQLLPHVGVHLGVGFASGQLLAVFAALLVAEPLLRLAERLLPLHPRGGDDDGGPLDEGWLARPLLASRAALAALPVVLQTRDRDAAVTAERALSEMRQGTERTLQSAGGGGEAGPTLGACLHLGAALDAALHTAEMAVERDFSLEEPDARTLARLEELLLEGLDGLIAAASDGAPVRLEDARTREIEINALEGRARRRATVLDGVDPESVPYHLWLSELLVAYEAIGNHLYRLATQLADEDEL